MLQYLYSLLFGALDMLTLSSDLLTSPITPGLSPIGDLRITHAEMTGRTRSFRRTDSGQTGGANKGNSSSEWMHKNG